MTDKRRARRILTALVVVLAVVTTACTGRYPGRLLSAQKDKVQIFATPSPDAAPTSAAPSAAAAEAAPATAPPQIPKVTKKILAKTSSGTTVRETTTGLPKADIWPDSEDRVGITASEIRLCVHAAFLLGPVFGNHPEDEDVYWRALNDRGGIHGRKVNIKFVDDAYTADGTKLALDKCKSDMDPFLYLGGVGFDQAPAGKGWAEDHKQPYLYNMAVETSNLKHSFSFLPSINMNGRFLGQFTGTHLKGKKVGIIFVDTDNWRAGKDEFIKEINKRGMSVEPGQEYAIPNNNYPDFGDMIRKMQGAGVELVLTYINALAMNRFILQADGQGFHPTLVTPDGFDLVSDVTGNGANGDGVDHLRNFDGVYAGWTSHAYEMGPPAAKNNPAVPWYSEMRAMVDAYKVHRPNKTPNDVDWMFWSMSKLLHEMLVDCTKECTRNILAGMMLTGYKKDLLGCRVDFSMGAGRLGGHYHNVFRMTAANDGRSYWRQIETCKQGF